MRDVLNVISTPAHPEHEIEVEIAAINVVDRLRLVDRDKVAMIAASISESYLHQPIAVATVEGSNRVELVDGEHRLEAFKLLGRQTISARIRELTEIERRKHEIHANLIRNELNALDRARFVGKLADIFAAENAGARNGGDRKSQAWLAKNQLANLANWSAFNKEAAARTGLGERSIRRDRELASALDSDVVALIGKADIANNQAQLQALAELPPVQQKMVARAIAAKPTLNLDAARVAAGLAPKGGAVRQADQLLARLEALLGRQWSLDQLKSAQAMLQTKLDAAEATAKPARAKKGGAA